ncbi:MAG: ABC transporter permease subunit [Oscillospiraceae bacterium]|jgi:NitT/TauT family transport system permease protein|nr:ABC transporter permease subunit [Oscillospiraceae bacterium]
MKFLKTFGKFFLKILPNILFIVLIALMFVSGERKADKPLYFIVAVSAMHIYFLISRFRHKDQSTGAFSILYLFLIIWEIGSRITGKANAILMPPPENVFAVFYDDRKVILKGLGSSMYLLVFGLLTGIIVSIILGLIIGWVPRLKNAAFPIVKVISAIPPLIYTPYVISFMPTFKSASIFVIFLGVFWPMLMSIINRVSEIDPTLIQCSHSLNIKPFTMVTRVVFPYCLPSIVGGLPIGISMSFMILTFAELLGGDSGLGFFVSRASQNSNYTRVIAGIIIIGIVVTVVNALVHLLQKRILRWA